MLVLRNALFLLAVMLGVAALPAWSQTSDTAEWFEVDTLNAGLPAASDRIDRATPRSSLESFLIAALNGRWADAAQMLDLSEIPPSDQAVLGGDLSRDLLNVLERKVVIDWYDLPDRPDGLDSRGSGDSPVAGQARRSILLWYVDVGDRPVPIRINRLKPRGGDPVWVVSRQTVDDLPALGDAYGPSKLEEMLPDTLRKDAFWGLRWWEVIALPIGLALTALAGWLTFKLMSKGYGRNRRIAPASLLVATRGPLVLLVMTLVLRYLTDHVFLFSGRIETILSPVAILGVVVAILWLVVNAADAVLSRIISFDGDELSEIGEGQEARRSAATKISAIRRFMLVIIAVVGVGIVLNEASVMRSLGISLLASAGTVTIIAAFAARNVLANIMASLQISLNQSARIGDKVVYRGEVCSVERVNFTYVQLRIWTGKRLVVPVSEFVSEPFENWTMQEHLTVFEVDLKLHHMADITPLRDTYGDLMDEAGVDDDQRGVMVTEHDALGQTVLFLVPSDNPNTGWRFSCEIREALLKRARELDREDAPMFPASGAIEEAAA